MTTKKRGFPAPKNPQTVEYLPGTIQGFSGRPDGSGRMLAPFGLLYPTGTPIKSFYNHNYKGPNEHYHATVQDLHECKRLNGQEVSYDG